MSASQLALKWSTTKIISGQQQSFVQKLAENEWGGGGLYMAQQQVVINPCTVDVYRRQRSYSGGALIKWGGRFRMYEVSDVWERGQGT